MGCTPHMQAQPCAPCHICGADCCRSADDSPLLPTVQFCKPLVSIAADQQADATQVQNADRADALTTGSSTQAHHGSALQSERAIDPDNASAGAASGGRRALRQEVLFQGIPSFGELAALPPPPPVVVPAPQPVPVAPPPPAVLPAPPLAPPSPSPSPSPQQQPQTIFQYVSPPVAPPPLPPPVVPVPAIVPSPAAQPLPAVQPLIQQAPLVPPSPAPAPAGFPATAPAAVPAPTPIPVPSPPVIPPPLPPPVLPAQTPAPAPVPAAVPAIVPAQQPPPQSAPAPAPALARSPSPLVENGVGLGVVPPAPPTPPVVILPPVPVVPSPIPVPAPAPQPAARGRWTPVIDFPVVPVAAALVRDKLLMWSSDQARGGDAWQLEVCCRPCSVTWWWRDAKHELTDHVCVLVPGIPTQASVHFISSEAAHLDDWGKLPFANVPQSALQHSVAQHAH